MEELSEIFGSLSDVLEITPLEVVAAVFVIIFFIALFIVIFMGYFRIILNIAYFAYPNARVKAIGNPCIGCDQISELAELGSVSEVMEKIRRFHYEINISEMTDIEGIEVALGALYLKDCKKIEETSPEGTKSFFRAYCLMVEADSLKTAMRAKDAGLPPDEIERKLIPVCELTLVMIRKIADARDVEEVILLLQNTAYKTAFTTGVHEHYIREKAILPLELALDRFVFQNLHASVFLVDVSMVAPVRRFVSTFSDITNLKMILRAKSDGVDNEVILDAIVTPGSLLPESKLKQLIELKDIVEIAARLEGTPYRSAIEKVLPLCQESGSIRPLETALEKMLLASVLTLDITYPHGAGPLIKFIVGKQYEIRNIRAVLWGIKEDLPGEKIREVVICEGVAA